MVEVNFKNPKDFTGCDSTSVFGLKSAKEKYTIMQNIVKVLTGIRLFLIMHNPSPWCHCHHRLEC